MLSGWKTITGAILAGVGAILGLIAPHMQDGSQIPWGEVSQRAIEVCGIVLAAIGAAHKLERIASKE